MLGGITSQAQGFYYLTVTCASYHVAGRATAAFVIVERGHAGLAGGSSLECMSEHGPGEAGP